MQRKQKWAEKYQQKKHLLSPSSDFNKYFSQNEINGKKLYHLNMGNVIFPTGDILVRDPLVYLHENEKPYCTKVPTGTFPIITLVSETDKDQYRYVATRIKFTDHKAISYTEALIGNENLDNLEEGEYFGFSVDTGLATIVDVKTRDLYCKFVNRWEKKHPNENIYDHFFAQEFEKNYESNPQFQGPEGDWINFKLPGSKLSVPMIQTGFGDGVYPAYMGYDENENVCEIIMQYIDIEKTFEKE